MRFLTYKLILTLWLVFWFGLVTAYVFQQSAAAGIALALLFALIIGVALVVRFSLMQARIDEGGGVYTTLWGWDIEDDDYDSTVPREDLEKRVFGPYYAPSRRCPSCGSTSQKANAKFCDACGKPLDALSLLESPDVNP